MKRILIVTIAFWVLLLSPGLCLAGALEHYCGDNSREATCSHEDDCAGDPCTGEALRPDAAAGLRTMPVGAAPSPDGFSAGTGRPRPSLPLQARLFPDRAPSPRPGTGLPLLS